MLTLPELQILMLVLDAGVKSAGIQIFQNEGVMHMHAALAKLQQMAEAAKKQEPSNG